MLSSVVLWTVHGDLAAFQNVLPHILPSDSQTTFPILTLVSLLGFSLPFFILVFHLGSKATVLGLL